MRKPFKNGREYCMDLHDKLVARGSTALDKVIYVPLTDDGRMPHVTANGQVLVGSRGAYFSFIEGFALLRWYSHDRRQLAARVSAKGRGGPSRVKITRWVKMKLRTYLRKPY
jgi:hypothetical protein